jgi:uncharacterized protein YuzE
MATVTFSVEVEWDPDHGTKYIRVMPQSVSVANTIAVTPHCNVDVDAEGQAVGIELL